LNSPGQIVLSGDAERVAAAAERAKEFGVKRAIPLPVAGAYHSWLMMGAQERLAAVLEQMELREDGLPVVSNFEARALCTAGEVRGALTRQVTGSVRWVESIQGLIAGGHRLFVELGPDAVLAGMIGKIDKTVQVISIMDLESLDAGVAALAG
jgi:[acyl-carrier-protein] S-malonyltransferase